MSLCTWATVVSTVPSPTLHGEIFGQSREPVPLPTFLSFLELLEDLNGGETEIKKMKLFCQESLNSSSSSSSSDIDLDKFLDLEGLNDEDIFEASSTEAANLGSNTHSSSFSSEYFCCPDYFLPSAEILPYEHQDFESAIKSGFGFDRVFSDWSPEIFQGENIENAFKDPAECKSTHEFPGQNPSKTAECKSTHEFLGQNPSKTAESKSTHDFSGQNPSKTAEYKSTHDFSGQNPSKTTECKSAHEFSGKNPSKTAECKSTDEFSGQNPSKTAECKSTDEFSGQNPSKTAESKSAHEFLGQNPLENESKCKCGEKSPFQKPEKENACNFLNAAGRKESAAAATSAHSGQIFRPFNGPRGGVKQKQKRKRKCTNCFERQESRSQRQSFHATCR